MISGLDQKRVDAIIRFSLKEDIWTGDLTSESVLDEGAQIDAVVLAKQHGVMCGMGIAERIVFQVDPDLKFRPQVSDGETVEPSQEICFIEGNAISIMKAERTLLNYISLLSGVATKTKTIVDKVEGTGVKIYDTRKTIPLHRYLQKYAVTVGGGGNHRKGLWDMVLIKDNHIRAYAMHNGTSDPEQIIKGIVRRAKANVQNNIRIEIEVETLKECEYALSEEPDVIMLDNMNPEMIRKAVEVRKNMQLEAKVEFEVSGGITLDNISEYASTGVDIISTGSITADVDPVDFSLEVILKDGKI